MLLASAGVRLWHVASPSGYIFDEIYYAKDAKAIVDGRVGPKPGPFPWEAGDEVSWPHPELGKFAIALGILAFGDRSFGWRLPSVIAGVALLAFVYPIARRLGLSPPWALLALIFAAADPLGITQSRIATLDIFVALWSVVCIYFALRYAQDGRRPVWLFATGVTGGIAIATKWSGGLALITAALILLVGWLWARSRARRAALADDPPAAALVADTASGAAAGRSVAASVGLYAAAFVVVPVVIYLLAYTQYFLAGHTWAEWVELQRQMVIFNLDLRATHTYASRADTWIIDYRPVWYYFKATNGIYRGVVTIGNPFLWWLATAALVAAPVLALARRTTLPLYPAALVAALYMPWFLTFRTSFLYYMAPVAPFMAILVAAVLVPFAGGEWLPRRAWIAAVAAAVGTALLWEPIGRVFEALGWASLGFGVAAAALVVSALSLPRLRPWRPWLAMVIAGAVAGIVVAFIPVVLALPITPEQFSHIMWFRSWI